jgi:hypothetical protein
MYVRTSTLSYQTKVTDDSYLPTSKAVANFFRRKTEKETAIFTQNIVNFGKIFVIVSQEKRHVYRRKLPKIVIITLTPGCGS